MSSAADRKKTFVDPQVQGALVRRLVLHWLGFFAVASAMAFVLQVLSNPFQPLGEHVRQLWWTQGPFLVVILFLLPVFLLDTIKLSHRFAGPIYRLRQTIRKVAEGEEPPKLKFRDLDFWQGLAEDFNKMVEALQNGKSKLAGSPIEQDEVEEVSPAIAER